MILVGLVAPHATFLGDDTSAHEPASISSTSILVKLADSEAIAWPPLQTNHFFAQEEVASQSVSSMLMPLLYVS